MIGDWSSHLGRFRDVSEQSNAFVDVRVRMAELWGMKGAAEKPKPSKLVPWLLTDSRPLDPEEDAGEQRGDETAW